MFKDHFSHSSVSYSKHRPGYPDTLFSHLSSVCRGHKLAWDCATGTGQSAVQLTKYFNRVVATDASESQINNALKHEGIKYIVSAAEESRLDATSVDLITVSQALHWLDLPGFTAEVDRVLKPAGVLAVWSYNLLLIRPDIDEQIMHLYSTVLKEHWPAERSLVEDGYKDIDFPLTELSVPAFNMSLDWSLAQLVAYLSNWSAVNDYILKNGKDPVDVIYPKLLKLWGSPKKKLHIQWPLTVRLWQKTEQGPAT
jgi:SAM-dependent methyltransferase